jgi:hypothetical protein
MPGRNEAGEIIEVLETGSRGLVGLQYAGVDVERQHPTQQRDERARLGQRDVNQVADQAALPSLEHLNDLAMRVAPDLGHTGRLGCE